MGQALSSTLQALTCLTPETHPLGDIINFILNERKLKIKELKELAQNLHS